MQLAECNMFEKLDNVIFQNFRKTLINNILSTDMRDHFPILHNFELKNKEFQLNKEKFGNIRFYILKSIYI